MRCAFTKEKKLNYSKHMLLSSISFLILKLDKKKELLLVNGKQILFLFQETWGEGLHLHIRR